MILHEPFFISARLMPAIKVAGATISLTRGSRDIEGRTVYVCFIDLPDGSEHPVTDLRSGCQGGSTLEGFTSLLSFLQAAGEDDLFPKAVADWAAENSDEISIVEYEIELFRFLAGIPGRLLKSKRVVTENRKQDAD